MSNSAYKAALDRLVEDKLGTRKDSVSRVTAALYEVLGEQLVHTGEVGIDGMGTLTVFTSRINKKVSLVRSDFKGGRNPCVVRVGNQIRVYFRKSPKLRMALKEYANGKVRSR